jgi:hypothetical protein
MSSPLALGAVSAVLRNLLDNGMVDASPLPGTVTVTASAPDQIKLDGAQDPPQLNVFLYQVTPNAALRNNALPSRSARGDRLTNPPLALDLHYLVTAYGKTDFQAEILLGWAMYLLHERPMLDRPAIRRALQPGVLDLSMLPPEYQVLSASDLADQVEAIRITPVALPLEELSKLWTAIKAQFRPSAAYLVSVVLIEAAQPARSPLPVLSRGPVDPLTQRDRGVAVQADLLPAVPTLYDAAPVSGQPVARLGESLAVTGWRLAGSGVTALLTHRLVPTPIELPVAPDPAGADFTLGLPNTAADQLLYPPGPWQLSLRVTVPGEAAPRESNAIGLAIAPVPQLPPLGAVRAVVPPQTVPTVTVTLQCSPQVALAQRATLALDGDTADAAPRVDPADPLVFVFPDSVPAGPRRVRLRVDGIDSLLVLRHAKAPPSFDPTQMLVVP